MSIDEYVTSLQKIARDCSLGEMYEDFMMQALLLGISDERLRRKLFEESENLNLETAIKSVRFLKTRKPI